MTSPNLQVATGRDGTKVAHRIWDGGEVGTLVFIHGLGADQRQFANDAACFAARGFRCLTFDLRGHGLSTLPESVERASFTVEAFADDLEPIISRHAKGPVHLIGNSLGGLVALALINKQAQNYRSLVTFGTAYRLHFPPGIPTLQYLVARLMGPKKLAEVISKNAGFSAQAKQLLRQMYSEVDLKVTYLTQKNIRVYDYCNVAVDFPGPIAILRGDLDRDINKQLPKSLAYLAELPGFRLYEIAEAGHFANLDQPERFREIIGKFLSEMNCS